MLEPGRCRWTGYDKDVDHVDCTWNFGEKHPLVGVRKEKDSIKIYLMDLVCEDGRLVNWLRWFKTYFSVPQNMQAETNISEFLVYRPIEHSSDLQFPYVNPVKRDTERQKIEGHAGQTAW